MSCPENGQRLRMKGSRSKVQCLCDQAQRGAILDEGSPHGDGPAVQEGAEVHVEAGLA
jgi:hypothetical protein